MARSALSASKMPIFQKLAGFARKSPREQKQLALANIRSRLFEWGWKVPHLGNDKTMYVIGLFGTGRWYVNGLILDNVGERARYFKDEIYFHPGPTSAIYSGHCTLKYASRAQALPDTTNRIFEAVRSGIADMVFVYRHPLDALLSNWIYWRIFLSERRMISGISQIYNSVDELSNILSRNFPEFKSFADGAPEFFAESPGLRFLSLSEYVEETELHLRSPALALRLEDFMIDPLAEFAKVAELMSIDIQRAHIARPKAKLYGYLAVRDKVPQFREFIDKIDSETRQRIENLGYSLND